MINAGMACQMGISVIQVKLWTEYRHEDPDITFPLPMGRPKKQLPGRREHAATLVQSGTGPVPQGLRGIEDHPGIHVPHNTIHGVLREDGLAARQPRKSGRRRWIRCERTYSMWHAGYKLDYGRWFTACRDDASRFIAEFGVFGEATGAHAPEVLEQAIKNNGKPASILTDHGSVLCK